MELINEAIVSPNDGEKVKSLQKVQSLVIHHNLIDNFLDEGEKQYKKQLD